MTRLSDEHARSFTTRAGDITVQRTRGYCRKCRKWRVPADEALGLTETAGYSPSVREMGALLVSKMPVAEASRVLEHLTGVKVPPATLDREVRRQGRRAEAVRTELDQHPAAPPPRACQLELMLEPYQWRRDALLSEDRSRTRIISDHFGKTSLKHIHERVHSRPAACLRVLRSK